MCWKNCECPFMYDQWSKHKTYLRKQMATSLEGMNESIPFFNNPSVKLEIEVKFCLCGNGTCRARPSKRHVSTVASAG